jgi:hypothetical protein
MIEKVNEEIEKTKENFFKVNVIKKSAEKAPLVDQKLNSNNFQSIKLPKIN